jgi:hypothetical protein
MFEKFSRSWALVKASATVLRSDKELLLLPLMSTIAALLVIASFVAPAIGLGWLDTLDDGGEMSPAMMVWVFAFYLSQYFVMFFFNSALVGAAMIRLDGGDPTVRDGLRIAFSKIGPIFGYAMIAATVGLILRMLEQRAGFIGQIVISMIGAAWTVVTFLAVPVLVARNIGPIDAVKESATLLKRSWGENVIGSGGIGLVFGLIIALVVMGGVALSIAAGAGTGSGALAGTLIGLTVLAVLLLALVQTALSGIYSALLYRYAVNGDAPAGVDGMLLANAFQKKV